MKADLTKETQQMVAIHETYKYERFHPTNYEPGSFPGPIAGEEVSYDYTFTDLAGESVSLADFEDRWLVVESGSLTCPMYVKNVKPFAELQEHHPDVEWLVVYVREAHPGEKLKQADSIEEKMAYAARTRDEYHESRRIVIDDLAGTWHHDWGLWPNTVWVINPDGTLIYRADWSMTDKVAEVLAKRDEIHAEDHVTHLGAPLRITVPVSFKGGWIALWDLVRAAPKAYFRYGKQKLQERRGAR